MPFLRILRDKRGVEHLSLCQPGRDGRPRVLYWFRSSSGAKAGGRAPLDEAARRDIERQFPDITFDWQALWETVTTATLPELAAPRAAAETSQGASGPAARPGSRSDRSEQATRAVEQGGPEQDRARRRRSARARRRPRSAQRRAAVEVSPASEVSE